MQQHAADVAMPDMTRLDTAFQHDGVHDNLVGDRLKFTKPIFLARHEPRMLARAIMDAGRQVRYSFAAADHGLLSKAI